MTGQVSVGLKLAHWPLLLTCVRNICCYECRRAEQVQRMQAALRAALAGDLAALKTAIQLYKEHVARLQCQKQLLLSQVRLMAPFGSRLTASHEGPSILML